MSQRSNRPINRAIDDVFQVVRALSILWVLFLGLVAVIMIFNALGDVFRYGLTWGELWVLIQIVLWIAGITAVWRWLGRWDRRREGDQYVDQARLSRVGSTRAAAATGDAERGRHPAR